MTKRRLSCVAAAVCSAVQLFLVMENVKAEEQPGGLYPQPPEDVVRKLLSVARKACGGTLSNPSIILKALNLNGPVYFYRERPAPEIVLIPVKYCPEPSPDAEFVIARLHHLQKGDNFFYKTSALAAKPIEAARSFFDPARNDLVYEPITVTSAVRENYNTVIQIVMTKWGR